MHSGVLPAWWVGIGTNPRGKDSACPDYFLDQLPTNASFVSVCISRGGRNAAGPASADHALAQGLLVGRGVEADQKGFSATQGRSPQGTAAPENQLQELFVVGSIGLGLEYQDLLAASDDQRGSRVDQPQGTRPIELVLRRVLRLFGGVVILREKLPRFGAARSTAALVEPVDLLGHGPRLSRARCANRWR